MSFLNVKDTFQNFKKMLTKNRSVRDCPVLNSHTGDQKKSVLTIEASG